MFQPNNKYHIARLMSLPRWRENFEYLEIKKYPLDQECDKSVLLYNYLNY